MNTGIFIVGFIIFSLYIFGLLYMINYSHKSQEEELKYLKNMLLANISKNIWGENTYYEIICIEDEFVQTALKQFN